MRREHHIVLSSLVTSQTTATSPWRRRSAFGQKAVRANVITEETSQKPSYRSRPEAEASVTVSDVHQNAPPTCPVPARSSPEAHRRPHKPKIKVKGKHNVYVSKRGEGGTSKRTDAGHTMSGTASEISGSGGGDGAATFDPQPASSHCPSRSAEKGRDMAAPGRHRSNSLAGTLTHAHTRVPSWTNTYPRAKGSSGESVQQYTSWKLAAVRSSSWLLVPTRGTEAQVFRMSITERTRFPFRVPQQ